MNSADVAALLAQLDAAMAATATPEGESEAPERHTAQALRFELCAQDFAIPATQVRAIARLGQVARLPGVGPHIAGITTLRGAVLPLINLAAMLGLTIEHPPQQVVVVADGPFEAGLLVHRVDALVPLPPPLPLLDTRPAQWRPLLQGELDTSESLVLVINVGALLGQAARAL